MMSVEVSQNNLEWNGRDCFIASTSRVSCFRLQKRELSGIVISAPVGRRYTFRMVVEKLVPITVS